MAEGRVDEADLKFYHALGSLIQRSDQDREALHEAARKLNRATRNLKNEFPDYAVLRALTEQAEQDQTAIQNAVQELYRALSHFETNSASMPQSIAERVGAAVGSQIEKSLTGAATTIIKQVQDRFLEIENASERARRKLEETANFAVRKVTVNSWLPFFCLIVGLLLGILFERWTRA